MSSINIVSDIVQLPSGVIKLTFDTSSEDMPAAVFAIEVLPTSRDPLDVKYRFSHICSMQELIEWPSEEDPELSYFRTNSIEMIFDIVEMAIETQRLIKADINKLVLQYNQLNDPEITGTTITISGSTEGGTEALNRVYYSGNSVNG